MRFRPVSSRKAELLSDPHLADIVERRPELDRMIDAYLWAYPQSPLRSRRSALIGIALIGLMAVITAYALQRRRRS
jgi:hypothetical protein